MGILKKSILICGVLSTLLAVEARAAWRLNTLTGIANYQFEGAGPGGNIWESKPTYCEEPYMFIELSQRPRAAEVWNSKKSVFFHRAFFEYLGGSWERDQVQLLHKKIETFLFGTGAGWALARGLSFEVGPLAFLQRSRLRDLASTDGATIDFGRLGSYFSFSSRAVMGRWEGEVVNTIGLLGFPQRQSAVEELKVSIERYLSDGRWSVGLAGQIGLFQVGQHGNRTERVGAVSDAVTRFRQGETDFSIIMLKLGYRL